MKKSNARGTLLLSAALTSAVGAAAILGHGWLASLAFAANIPVEMPAVVTAEAKADASGGNAETEPQLVLNRQTTPPDENGTGTIMKELDNGIIVFALYDENGPKVDVTYDLGDGRREISYESDAD
ncbi:MAG: hypothetical protein LBB57_03705 [Clostridiales Family XIII bacterium]|jgi:hypothetical protein|nr:hypothetical protein [Clostridiales Family XIII bacterium]